LLRLRDSANTQAIPAHPRKKTPEPFALMPIWLQPNGRPLRPPLKRNRRRYAPERTIEEHAATMRSRNERWIRMRAEARMRRPTP
jgi:hypothetical protein